MSQEMIQLLILAGIVVFMVMRLRNALGTRDGYEGDSAHGGMAPTPAPKHDFEVIEGGLDQDIADHTDVKSDDGDALTRMKRAEPSFGVSDFIGGARGAYEMILIAFERGDMVSIKPYLADDVFEAFNGVVEARKDQGLTVEAEFIGVREVSFVGAQFVDDTRRATIDIKFLGEMTSAVRNADGVIIEGDPNTIKKQRDVWSFSRIMGSDDPNWQLVATGE